MTSVTVTLDSKAAENLYGGASVKVELMGEDMVPRTVLLEFGRLQMVIVRQWYVMTKNTSQAESPCATGIGIWIW